MTAARLVYNQFLGATQNWGYGSALSMTLILIVSISISLVIKFGEATPDEIRALLGAGLVLFVMTLIVNLIANWIVARSVRTKTA